MKNKIRPFHLAFPVNNLNQTIKWYTENLSCTIGRKDKKWVDFNFFGHQISAHLSLRECAQPQINVVDSQNIPARHFGIILETKDWDNLSKKLTENKVNFIIKPCIRFKGKLGEQTTMFIEDPSGNVLEFKSFKNDSMIFND